MLPTVLFRQTKEASLCRAPSSIRTTTGVSLRWPRLLERKISTTNISNVPATMPTCSTARPVSSVVKMKTAHLRLPLKSMSPAARSPKRRPGSIVSSLLTTWPASSSSTAAVKLLSQLWTRCIPTTPRQKPISPILPVSSASMLTAMSPATTSLSSIIMLDSPGNRRNSCVICST